MRDKKETHARVASHAEHMLEAIRNIQADVGSCDLPAFVKDRRTRQLVERNLEIISEASRRLPDGVKQSEPDIPWKRIAGLGNILRHDYAKVAPQALWAVCRQDLQPLKAAVARILKCEAT